MAQKFDRNNFEEGGLWNFDDQNFDELIVHEEGKVQCGKLGRIAGYYVNFIKIFHC